MATQRVPRMASPTINASYEDTLAKSGTDTASLTKFEGIPTKTKRKKMEKITAEEEKPLIIYSYRKVKTGGMDVYNQKAAIWANHCKKKVPGFKTNTYCEFPETGPGEANEDRKDWVADIQFFNSIDVFKKHLFKTDPKGLVRTLKFLGGTEQKTKFTGYGFGDWNKSVMLGMKVPRMFSMMRPPKWFEMRRDTAGFIRGTAAPKSTPPYYLVCDFYLKNAEANKEAFIDLWKSVADANAKNADVLAFQLTEDEPTVRLVDTAKQRNPYKLVAVMIFSDLPSLEQVVGTSLNGIDQHLDAPCRVDIWAEDDNARASQICAQTFGGNGKYTCFHRAHGWSDHSEGAASSGV